jgi:hypothetical protein
VALRGEATGVATCCNAHVVATARRDLAAGETLDGEGGYTVWGKRLPAQRSMRAGGLPLGLAHNVKLVRAVTKGQSLSWGDAAIRHLNPCVQAAPRDGGAVHALFAGQGGLRRSGRLMAPPRWPALAAVAKAGGARRPESAQ